ncbi:hypothetical protein KIF53_09830 [Chromobacterium subtsugae]|uniref:Uncharacterized protein n=1 Tax=Chromobacterium subtsugae TaxID=251747 RepID=A0ABS7FCW9_9NEIS|nr:MULTISPECIES: hypothetical protein [Chromobacterium]KUM01881.1 hypothetical protein Cv017_05880 [Chromobacterium subtsugae]KZE88225.1 hypothetical protein AWB61_07805 [Chromobacterium sp. F49]MBW7565593.1 hypothetical protein [Chromobacterium subtsugae]MBW8287924.1 hypothetical protein [Chromobacterium subtsugae]OBU86926.1 hypothetical protein MY55_09080 [Chromobacterium subtsugae]
MTLIIVLMGWLYVVLMLALTQGSVAGGLAVAFFLGVLPTWFVAWATRNKLRRRRAAEKDAGKA